MRTHVRSSIYIQIWMIYGTQIFLLTMEFYEGIINEMVIFPQFLCKIVPL